MSLPQFELSWCGNHHFHTVLYKWKSICRYILAMALFIHIQYTHIICIANTNSCSGTHITEYLQVRALEQMMVSFYPTFPVHLWLYFIAQSFPFSPLITHPHHHPPLSYPHTCIQYYTLASLPIWSSARLLLVRPGVVVGSPPSPSTPGQTFRSCIPCRNMLEQDGRRVFKLTHTTTYSDL